MLSLNDKKKDQILTFIIPYIDKILEIANNLSLLRVVEKEHYLVCIDEMMKFELFFDIIRINEYEKKHDDIFLKKNFLLEELRKGFQFQKESKKEEILKKKLEHYKQIKIVSI